MHFAVQKDVLVRALKDVNSAIATRVVQPILSNILIDTVDETTIKFHATDLDLSIESKVNAVVYTQGSITLPGKKLVEIVSKLPNELVSFQVNTETLETAVHCHRSKFSLTGLPASDFPKSSTHRSANGVLMPADVLKKAIVQTSVAAAGYDVNSILGGVYMVINEGVFECAATDGSRLAHRRETLGVMSPASQKADKEIETEAQGKSATATLEKPPSLKAIVPARACTELVRLLESVETKTSEVRLAVVNGLVTFETETHYLSSRLIAGEYPKYHELFPNECKYLATFKRDEIVTAIDRVAIMSDERLHLIKLHFEKENLQITANTPDVGTAQEEVPMQFEGQVLDIAVNVRYVSDALQRLNCEAIHLEMTGPLRPIVIKVVGDENYRYLVMPVQPK